MNFSTKVRYGTRAMIDIAKLAGKEGGVTISSVAEAQDLSQKYLENLLVKLKNGGLLKSSRGKNGGYSLKSEPSEITLYNIYEVLEGSLNLVDCQTGGDTCPRMDNCSTSPLWSHLTETLAGEMKRITLSDLVEGHIKDETVG